MFESFLFMCYGLLFNTTCRIQCISCFERSFLYLIKRGRNWQNGFFFCYSPFHVNAQIQDSQNSDEYQNLLIKHRYNLCVHLKTFCLISSPILLLPFSFELNNPSLRLLTTPRGWLTDHLAQLTYMFCIIFIYIIMSNQLSWFN